MKKIDSKDDVEGFLKKACEILNDESFDVNKNFYFKRIRNNYIENNQHTYESTMIELNYGLLDVVNEIKSLTVQHYKETIIDNQIGKIKHFIVL